jgi:hypothetical protein
MGAGMGAGAFADGFYKGYSLIEKSIADKQERELKVAQQKAALDKATFEMNKEVGNMKTQFDTTSAKLLKDQADAYNSGDVEAYNVATNAVVTAANTYNTNAQVIAKQAGLNFVPIEIPSGSSKTIEAVDYKGQSYVVPTENAAEVKKIIGQNNGLAIITDDKKLGILQIDDKTGKVLVDESNKPMLRGSFDTLNTKSTGNDAFITAAYKEYISNFKPTPETTSPLSMSSWKTVYYDNKTDNSTEAKYRAAKENIANDSYQIGENGNLTATGQANKEADIKVVEKFEQKGAYADKGFKLTLEDKAFIALKKKFPDLPDDEIYKKLQELKPTQLFKRDTEVQQQVEQKTGQFPTTDGNPMLTDWSNADFTTAKASAKASAVQAGRTIVINEFGKDKAAKLIAKTEELFAGSKKVENGLKFLSNLIKQDKDFNYINSWWATNVGQYIGLSKEGLEQIVKDKDINMVNMLIRHEKFGTALTASETKIYSGVASNPTATNKALAIDAMASAKAKLDSLEEVKGTMGPQAFNMMYGEKYKTAVKNYQIIEKTLKQPTKKNTMEIVNQVQGTNKNTKSWKDYQPKGAK